MHHIYRTKAFVINSFETKEADKDLLLLTKDFGLIRVRAQGIRKGTSKLKYSLQDFSLAEIALVRGRNGYRLTNAGYVSNFFYENKNIETVKIISRFFLLIYKLVHGEDDTSNLFHVMEKFVELVGDERIANHKNLEIITVINILHSLGYFTKNYNLDIETINNLSDSERVELIKEINSSIEATQL